MNRLIGKLIKTAFSGAALTVAAASPAAYAAEEPFKQTNIHFETNASACDMGIQMSFDTDGLTEGEVEGPFEQVVFSFRAVDGMEVTDDLTEMFHERVEPPIPTCWMRSTARNPRGIPSRWPSSSAPGRRDGMSSMERAAASSSRAGRDSRTRFPPVPRSSRRRMEL